MSLHYILDGYNIIKQLPKQNKKALYSSRNALIHFIEANHPQGSKKNQVTIVFDGKEDVLAENIQTSIEIIFTRNESADDRIKKIVERAKNPKEIIVVTDDREIIFFVKYCGARAMKVLEFLSPKGTKTLSQDTEDEKHIPAEVQFRITEELKKIWLKN